MKKVTLLLLALFATAAGAEEWKTLIGPSNANLTNGADALLAGNAEEGVRLTHLGLKVASGNREKALGLANLCAGYAMLSKWDVALPYCDDALEMNDSHWRTYSNRAFIYVRTKRFAEAEADIARGMEIAPTASNLKLVQALLMQEMNPVAPTVIIDDRRDTEEEAE